jgi:hypothetical protein
MKGLKNHMRGGAVYLCSLNITPSYSCCVYLKRMGSQYSVGPFPRDVRDLVNLDLVTHSSAPPFDSFL